MRAVTAVGERYYRWRRKQTRPEMGNRHEISALCKGRKYSPIARIRCRNAARSPVLPGEAIVSDYITLEEKVGIGEYNALHLVWLKNGFAPPRK